ncbi:MAG: AraC family transcriptional regulator ligand-binding domain-containing protein [Pseudomonadota bacterium]
MKRANKFVFAKNWLLLIRDLGIDVADVLTCAQLPADLFNRDEVLLSPAEYFQLWRGLETASGDEYFALRVAGKLSVEAFDPAIFACLCSENLNTALARLQKYKPLIGPLALTIESTHKLTKLTIDCYGIDGRLPKSLALTELVFFTQVARLATRVKLRPETVTLPELPDDAAPYRDYFGCDLKISDTIEIHFRTEDAERPFMTSNSPMWRFFEQTLNQRLRDMNQSASMTERVKAVLLETLPAGDSSIERVCDKLAVSKRTLQRKLSAEAESYQSVLQQVRKELANHYLKHSTISLGEISFMLGFSEPNSFYRAYNQWNGVTPGQFRELHH